ncbi:hypothetical protein Poli38472_013768 [Pythium oligandrum]|uniref:Alkylglycerone-phosphate synthase n=1 Tax=Pythium oligandrum TaxID=41045 RepID=A0A8K1FF65_PYTOL|nr:hypothetical protein Poli38472_013768 [Pythium oligandrum]|eukprot:TMW61305.1 hypothetical protein Poli38472_013768 [Pythium oligandrum]
MPTQDERVTPATVARMRNIISHISGAPVRPDDVANRVDPPAQAWSAGPSRNAPTRWNGWGYEDTKLYINANNDIEISGGRYAEVFHAASDRVLPSLRPWAERVIGLDPKQKSLAVNRSPEQLQVTDPQLSESQQDALDRFLRVLQDKYEIRVSTTMNDRVRHSHGQTCEEIYKLRNAKHLGRIPDVVVWPNSHRQVEDLVQEATKFSEAVCLVPHGGGTNVTNALECSDTESRAIVSIDLRQMKRILHVDKENMIIRVEAGVTGLDLHERLRNKGLTLGHEPDSWEFSTLGGWVATKASGMKKNIYGNIEDLLVNLKMVTPRGTLERAANAPRVSMGPDVQQAVLGSEGILGVVTEVTLRVRTFPQCQVYDSLVFPTFEHGVAAMHEVIRAKCVPASIRLLDNTQFQLGQATKPSSGGSFASGVVDFAKKTYVTKIRGFNVETMCAATVLMEGTPEEVERQQKKIQAIAKEHHGLVGGAENGQRGYFFTYIIAYLRDFALDYYFMSESFETAVPWSNVQQLCDDVKTAIQDVATAHHIRTPPLIACRVTQLYETGVTVYVYYGVNYFGLKDPVPLFRAVESAAVDAILTNGGSLSHHHGIGKHRRAWLPNAISAPGIAMIKGMKQALDPSNIFSVTNVIEPQ